MKPLVLVAILRVRLAPIDSHASLGGIEGTVQQDQANFQGSQTNFYRHPNYRVHEITQDRLSIREYVSLDGKVFAVAWKGPAHPDLSSILGDHFQDYKKAMEAYCGRHAAGLRSLPKVMNFASKSAVISDLFTVAYGFRACCPEALTWIDIH